MTWQEHAACRDHDPELFWPNGRRDTRVATALAICATCPVAEQCAAYATEHRIRDGVWGGRDRGKRRGGPGRPPAKCGTPSGYRRHLKRKETPCQPCRDANTAAAKQLPSYRPRNAKLTAEQVLAIREGVESGRPQAGLAAQFGVTPAQVNKIVKGLAWADV